jgi:hypothetical protein
MASQGDREHRAGEIRPVDDRQAVVQRVGDVHQMGGGVDRDRVRAQHEAGWRGSDRDRPVQRLSGRAVERPDDPVADRVPPRNVDGVGRGIHGDRLGVTSDRDRCQQPQRRRWCRGGWHRGQARRHNRPDDGPPRPSQHPADAQHCWRGSRGGGASRSGRALTHIDLLRRSRPSAMHPVFHRVRPWRGFGSRAGPHPHHRPQSQPAQTCSARVPPVVLVPIRRPPSGKNRYQRASAAHHLSSLNLRQCHVRRVADTDASGPQRISGIPLRLWSQVSGRRSRPIDSGPVPRSLPAAPFRVPTNRF